MDLLLETLDDENLESKRKGFDSNVELFSDSDGGEWRILLQATVCMANCWLCHLGYKAKLCHITF